MATQTHFDTGNPDSENGGKARSQNSQISNALRRVSSRPLDLSPGFPEIAARWEHWWARANRTPLLLGGVRKTTVGRWDKAFDLLGDPSAWLEVRRAQCENTYWIDATPPSIRVDIGPVTIGAYVGAPLEFDTETQTSWQTPIIEDWAKVSASGFTPSGEWLPRVKELLAATARDGAGQYLVCLPDLSGAIDTLANLRGTERLIVDLFDEPEAVKSAADALVAVWEGIFFDFYTTILDAGSAPVQWLNAWSETPYTIPTCDFNAMIGPDQFREFCLPSLSRQGAIAGRCLFHLDGPDAARHAPALAETREITAVQFTPGAGTPSALVHVPMFRMLQDAGKPILVVCPYDETVELANKLDPGGLAIWPHDVPGIDGARKLEDTVAARRG